MSLSPGDRVGTYEVVARLGAGGMGEVYRARDTDLGRHVALKVLPDEVSGDADRVARFEREARTLAALNHPNIAHVHGLERSPVATAGRSAACALVMELVEGEDLSDRIAQGRIPLDQALDIARQVALALEAAHEAGIVHRDLKPANIKIRADGTVKVLDFGLAKVMAGDRGDALAHLDTRASVTSPAMTMRGVILGTAAYMSPEQARGGPIDRRADVWAFGCVLFEMLTGQLAFPGGTLTDTLARVLEREPDWSQVPASTPPPVVALLRRCLAKDPARRLRDVADARLIIEDVSSGVPTPPQDIAPAPAGRRAWLPWAIGLSGMVLGAALALPLGRFATAGGDTAARADLTMFGLSEPPGEPLYLFADPIKLSPDGRQVALITNGAEGRPRLWLRSMDSLSPEPIASADGAMFPFWSPDGRSIGFTAQGEVRVLDVASRAVRTLAKGGATLGGGAWNRAGVILYVDGLNGFKRIPAAGGPAVPVPSPGPSSGAGMAIAPQFLPDGHHFLYLFRSPHDMHGAVMIGDLDSDVRTMLMPLDSVPLFAPPDHVIYARDGSLVAQAFDTARLQLVGSPVVLADRVWMWISGGLTAISASENGVLAFATRRTPTTQMRWVDRNGTPLSEVGEAGLWVHVELSHDETRLAAERMDERTGTGVIWLRDLARATSSRLTPDPAWSLVPVWTPTDDRIAFGSSRQGASDLFVRATNGADTDVPLLIDEGLKLPTDWLPDGRTLVFNHISGSTGVDIWMLPALDQGKPVPLVQTPFNEGSGKVSPNGKWLAYVSNESGRPEVYVRALSGSEGRWQISQGGGSQPRWRRDGAELFFLSDSARLMAVPITTGPSFVSGTPVALPIGATRDLTGWRYTYDVADRGRRFLVIEQATTDPSPPIAVLVNWTAALKR